MHILVRRNHDEVCVSLSGRLDGSTCGDFDAAVDDFLDRDGLSVLLELTDLEYVSSAGLASFLKLSKLLSAHGGSLSFTGLRGEVRKVFDASGLDRLFDLGKECFDKPLPAERKALTAAASTEALSLPACTDSMQVFQSFLSSYLRRSSLGTELLPTAELVLEEAFVNISRHAYRGSPGVVELVCRRDESHLCMEFRDQGPPFNPLDQEAPQLQNDIEQRSIGGLGIHLIREMALKAEYVRQGEMNIFRVWIGKPCENSAPLSRPPSEETQVEQTADSHPVTDNDD